MAGAWVQGKNEVAMTATGKALLPAGSTGRSLAPPGIKKKRGGGALVRADNGDDAHRTDPSTAKAQEYRAISNGSTVSEVYQRYFEFSNVTRSQLEGDLRAFYKQLELAQKFVGIDGGGGGGGSVDGGVFFFDGFVGEDGPDNFNSDDTATRQLVAQLEGRHEVLEEQLTSAWDEVLRKDKACRHAHDTVEKSNAKRHRADIESSTSLALAARQLGE